MSGQVLFPIGLLANLRYEAKFYGFVSCSRDFSFCLKFFSSKWGLEALLESGFKNSFFHYYIKNFLCCKGMEAKPPNK